MRKNADARVKTWKVQKLQATVAQQQDVFQSKLAEQQKQIVARRPQGDGYSVASISCKPRGGPKISRMRIASRKLDFDTSNVAMSDLKSAPLASDRVSAAAASTGALTLGGC